MTPTSHKIRNRINAVQNRADLTSGSVLLDHLFASMEQGKTLVSEAADGRLLHINDAPSGLACNCVCPGCGRRMVAKKGQVQAHHFAHHAQEDGLTCVSPGETALHKWAKQILDDRLELYLPGLIAEGDGDQEVVTRPKRWLFNSAILESQVGQIVPDVVLLLLDRRLIVEFKVTHACDERKIARIREMNVGAIEIDLSEYRDQPLKEIGNKILFDAPRVWLHNPREAEARKKLEERAKQRAEKKKKDASLLGGRYRHRFPSEMSGNGECETAINKDALSDLVNLPIDGSGCFTVPLAEWQAAILLTLFSNQELPFRTRNGLDSLRQRGWLNRAFADISDELVVAIRESGVHFNSPIKTVEAYLKQLELRGFLTSGKTEIWYISEPLRRRVEEASERRERPVTLPPSFIQL